MIKGLFGNTTLPYALRSGLQEATTTHKAIAARVAGAMDASSSTDFAGQLTSANGKTKVTEADLQRDMTELADTQLRFEADAKLLQQVYARLRTAIRDNRG